MCVLGLQALPETGILLTQSVAFPPITKQIAGKPPAGSLPSLFCLTKRLFGLNSEIPSIHLLVGQPVLITGDLISH